jgi:hypothetical protein
MADVTANYELERLKLELQIQELTLGIKRGEVRVAEIEDEKRRIMLNRDATEKAIAEASTKLTKMGGKNA